MTNRPRVAWERGRVMSWITTTDHKRIGILYVATSLVFLLLGGLMALLIRTQLIQSGLDVVSRDTYNQLFTMHGTTMVFLVVVPVWAGLANYLLPLMLGTRDMAFPRLNAFSYWMFVIAGITLFASWFAEWGAPRTGWTAYPPISVQVEGVGQDLWILSLHLLTASSLAGAINFLVTIHNMRSPGMTWLRLPLFVWSIEVFAWLLVAILPVLSAGLTLLLVDRQFDLGTKFFVPTEGGDPVLYQHAFWFFGHPEVYVMILPAFGIISEVIPVFARKPIFGYKVIAYSTVAIGFYSLLVWAHHMFTLGLPNWLNAFFMITTMTIAVPTGIKIFNWLATVWRGNIHFDTPMLFALGFIGVFTFGGLTGIFVAAFPFDWLVHDTYFVVGHMHYVLFGGSIMALFAGLHYWWPKMFGRKLSEGLGKWTFWLFLIGMNLAFFPQHLLGLDGMPRRVWTYENEPWWEAYNLASSVGAYMMGLGFLLFLINIQWSRRRERRVGNDPWIANTLEWYTTSPPPAHNFDAVPYVTSARPLRDLRQRIKERG